MCLSPSVHQRGARSFTGFGLRCNPKFSGGDIEEVPPDPIPNSEVKLFGADGTATVTLWESRSLPDFFTRSKPRGSRFEAFFIPWLSILANRFSAPGTQRSAFGSFANHGFCFDAFQRALM